MRRLFLLVATVVLVDTMSYAAIAPLLPSYTEELGLSKAGAGVLSASYAAGTLLAALPGGFVAMRAGVKRTVLAGLGVMSLSSLVFGLANDVVVLDAARFAQGVGGAFSWAGGLAWLVHAAEPGRRGELLGSAIGAAIVGVVLGPVLGAAAVATSPGLAFGGVAVAGAGLALWAWTIPAAEAPERRALRALLPALSSPGVAAGIWLVTLPALFAGLLEVLAPLRLDALGATGLAVGAVFLVAALAEAVVSPVVGRLSDRLGRLVPIRVGVVGATVMAIVLPLPGSAVLLAAGVVAAVAALGTFWAPAMALLSDAAEAARLDQGLGFGFVNLAWAGGHVLGGAGGGGLAHATSDAVPYVVMAALCGLTLAILAPLGQALRREALALPRAPA